MKKVLITFSFAIVFLTGNMVSAQTKVGYINFSDLVKAMPEANDVKTKIDAYSNQFMDQLKAMYTEYQGKLDVFNKTNATMTDAVRTAKAAELTDFQKRMNDYQADAQQKVTARTDELSKPLFDKARAAIALVAKEKGYGYVINSAQTDFIVSPPGDDLIADVKAKLGLK